MEYVVKLIAERLARMGHDIIVLTGKPDIEKPDEEEVNGVRVMRWPTWAPGRAYHVSGQRSRLELHARRATKDGVDFTFTS